MMTRFLMMRGWILLPLCLLFIPQAEGRRRVVAKSLLPPGHILFIGAHPDDEVPAAPLLGSLCAEGASTCSFLILTRGEAGTCALPSCTPDLGTTREREMQSSAAIFGGTVIQWTFPDASGGFDAAWGPRGDLMERIAGAIRDERPGVIITFDPLHGTTCHPAHRETGTLVIDAVAHLGTEAPPLFLLETAASLDSDSYRFGPAVSQAMAFDAAGQWAFILAAAEAHQSQFSGSQLQALRSTRESERKVWLVRHTGMSRNALVNCP